MDAFGDMAEEILEETVNTCSGRWLMEHRAKTDEKHYKTRKEPNIHEGIGESMEGTRGMTWQDSRTVEN